MKLSTEDLLTSPDAFGLTTASPCQRAVARVIDGAPLGALATDPQVIELVGGAEALPHLPSRQPALCLVLAAIRSGKTMTAGAAGSKMALTVDTSGLKHGEVPRVSIVSLKLDTSAVAFGQIVGAWEASPVLRPLILDKTADTLTVRHPTGRPIEIACVAGAKAGSGLVARWSAGVIFDEAPRMSGRQDGVVNLDDALSAVMGRMLPGASIIEIGSPWAPSGTCYDQVQEHWRQPSEHIVVLRGTGPMLNPGHWTPERCDELEARNPVAYQTDVLGEFADPESGLLNPISVSKNVRERPLDLIPTPPIPGVAYSAALDPGEGRLTLVIVKAWIQAKGELPMYKVAFAHEYTGKEANTWPALASDCLRYGCKVAVCDQYAAGASETLAQQSGLRLHRKPWNAANKLAAFTNLATLIHGDRVELPPNRQFRRDLLGVKKRTTQQGYTIVLPRTSDGRHCDFAPALAAAVSFASARLRIGNTNPVEQLISVRSQWDLIPEVPSIEDRNWFPSRRHDGVWAKDRRGLVMKNPDGTYKANPNF